MDKFGVMPIEGFGCTELSPVVSINVPEEQAGKRISCGKTNSVGKPISGVELQIINPESRAPEPTGTDGLLLVKGPNVMQGYLEAPEQTSAVIQDGWYNTGDMAHIDDDGYIFITGLYSRFSKIGGEMVSHGAVEEAIQSVLGTADSRTVVTAVPDPVRGERLLVLHLPIKSTSETIANGLREAGLPNLWVPKATDFYEIDEIPILGSGKLDLKAIRDLAEEMSGR